MENKNQIIAKTFIGIIAGLIIISLLAVFIASPKPNNPPIEKPNKSHSTPVAEWGWNNLEEMGYALIRVDGYDVSVPNNAYVYTTGITKYEFKNGYVLRSLYNDNKSSFDYHESDEYQIIDNDTLKTYAFSDNGDFHISDRITSPSKKNFILLVHEYYYIVTMPGQDGHKIEKYCPEVLIDWSRTPEKFTKTETLNNGTPYEQEYIKLYLK